LPAGILLPGKPSAKGRKRGISRSRRDQRAAWKVEVLRWNAGSFSVRIPQNTRIFNDFALVLQSAAKRKEEEELMAFLYEESFVPGSGDLPGVADDKNALLKRIKQVLLDISGPPVITSVGNLYPKPPRGLDQRRDQLKANYRKIWDDTIISFEFDKYGATADLKTYEIDIGEFFLKKEIPLLDLKKVVLHEFLHLVVDLPKVMHHGQINHIISKSLGLKGDPNPFGTD
jgi:hypothetical protein